MPQDPRHRMLRHVIRRRPDGTEEVVTRGLEHRRSEYGLLRDAAEGGSVQARMRLPAARKALRRQEEESRRRLRRVS